eukprot:TRINITY_DN3902_c0_g1_i1.p1 TRINITY_DN3902_c0_g1~~TRINITY_DN3902_c0_g1_i1.p1  ORF type:complete len:831 (-),score=147.97 TRINITY_DN3902_c0_g1_i1:123-2615(-)
MATFRAAVPLLVLGRYAAAFRQTQQYDVGVHRVSEGGSAFPCAQLTSAECLADDGCEWCAPEGGRVECFTSLPVVCRYAHEHPKCILFRKGACYTPDCRKSGANGNCEAETNCELVGDECVFRLDGVAGNESEVRRRTFPDSVLGYRRRVELNAGSNEKPAEKADDVGPTQEAEVVIESKPASTSTGPPAEVKKEAGKEGLIAQYSSEASESERKPENLPEEMPEQKAEKKPLLTQDTTGGGVQTGQEQKPVMRPETEKLKRDPNGNAARGKTFLKLNHVKKIPGFGKVKGYNIHTGSLPVRSKRLRKILGGTDLFFTFVRMAEPSSDEPLVLWLNGGPGCSSLGGFLMGVGPLFLDRCPNRPVGAMKKYAHGGQQEWCPDNAACKEMPSAQYCQDNNYQLIDNWFSWHQHANLLFLETPPSVGFSHYDSSKYSDVRKALGGKGFEGAKPARLGKFHAKVLAEIMSGLENDLLDGDSFGSVTLAGESYAGIYLSHMLPPLLENPEMKDRLKGVLVGNPKLGIKERFDAAPAAMVRRCLVNRADYDTFTSHCGRESNFSELIDLKTKTPNACTQAFTFMYERGNRNSAKAGASWYNADALCERCNGQHCSPECFNTKPYERFWNNRGVKRAFGADPATTWSFCKDVSKLIQDFPMVPTPPFLENPSEYLRKAGRQDLKFWVFSGDSDLESLAEVSMLSMARAFGAFGSETTWRDGKGSDRTLGTFTSFKDFPGAQLVTVYGGGHLVPYYATEAAVDLVRRFLSDDLPAEHPRQLSFFAPTLAERGPQAIEERAKAFPTQGGVATAGQLELLAHGEGVACDVPPSQWPDKWK